MKPFRKKLILLLSVVLINNGFGQTWPCAQYITRQILVSGNTYKSQVSVLYTENGEVGLEPVCENTQLLLNASALYEGYIYAWKQYSGTAQNGSSTTLVKLNNDCTSTNYPITFPTTVNVGFNNAYVDEDGNFYMANTGTAPNLTIYKINLNTLTLAGPNNATAISITPATTGQGFTSFSAGIGDMYYDGTDIYIWNNGQGLAKITYNSATAGTYVRIPNTTNVNEVVGSLFVNSEEPGFLFGYGSSTTTNANTQTTIVKINLSTGQISDVVDGGAAVSQSDGAGCEVATFNVPPPIALSDGTCFVGGGTVAPIVNDIAYGPATNLINATSVNLIAPSGAMNIITDADNDLVSMLVPNEGTWSVNETSGAITFSPILGFNGVPMPISYTVEDNGGQLSNVALVSNVGCTALPVTLVNFSAKQLDSKIVLNWKTANELNFSHFEVQKSGDLTEFNSISQIKGTSGNFYNYVDHNPNKGLNYYRLKMVDLDGSIKFSPIKSVEFRENTEFIEVQNPVENGEINVFSNAEIIKFELFTIIGKAIDIQVNKKENNQYSIKTTQINSGIYFLKTHTENGFKTKKLLLK